MGSPVGLKASNGVRETRAIVDADHDHRRAMNAASPCMIGRVQ
jgi:hypothetical protein